MIANGSALLRYAMIIYGQKLTQVIKSNTAGFLRIQRHYSKILKKILKSRYITNKAYSEQFTVF